MASVPSSERGGAAGGKPPPPATLKETERAALRRIVLIVTVITVVVLAVLLILIQWQGGFSGNPFIPALLNACIFTFLGLAVIVVVGPTAIKLYDDDILGKTDSTTEEWTVRLRTVLTVSLTIVVLLLALVWFINPTAMDLTSATSTSTDAYGNTTTNTTVQLRPFVKSFMDMFTTVIEFYFGASAVEAVAKTLKGNPEERSDNGGGSGAKPSHAAAHPADASLDPAKSN